MQASTLKEIARVADLSKLDFTPARVVLHTTPTELSATYVAAYNAGRRSVPRTPDVPELHAELEAQRFQSICDLFDDNSNVTLSLVKNDLQLRGGGNAIKVRLFPVETDDHDISHMSSRLITLQRAALLTEVEIAAVYVASSVAKAALTGVCLIMHGDTLTIQAFNGFSALFTSELKLSQSVDGEITVIVPAKEILYGLRALTDDEITLFTEEGARRLLFRGKSSWFHCALLTDPWPNTDALKGERTTVSATVDAKQIKSCVSAVHAFESHKMVELVTMAKQGLLGSTTVLRTAGGQTGQYITRVTTKETIPSTWYDATDLGLAQNLTSPGTPMELLVGIGQGIPTQIKAGHRAAYIITRYGPSNGNEE